MATPQVESKDDQVVISLAQLKQFTVSVMTKAGARPAHAETLADVIIGADRRGHYSHGMNRLDFYAMDISKGVNCLDKEPEVVKQGPSTALVKGNNCIGAVVGTFCMDLAIEKAKTTGIGWVSVAGSNHFGIASWYSCRAMEQGLIGMAFCNTSPKMVHPRGKQILVGTNPFSVAAQGDGQDQFVLDMATTAVAQGKVVIAQRLGKEIPSGWGVDRHGNQTTDIPEILYHGGLCPLGGAEETGGYKGFALGMMVELFCGILSGSKFGRDIRTWTDKGHSEEANLGQCFVALDPDCFAPGFSGRLSALINQVKTSEPREGQTELPVAGDPEAAHIRKCSQLGGVPYHQKQVDFMNFVADKYKVARVKTSTE